LTFEGVFCIFFYHHFWRANVKQEARRKTKLRRFDILVVPTEEGGTTRRFRAGRWKIGLLATALFLLCVAITLAILIFTPVMMFLPLPNPVLEAKYGRQLAETQERLNVLAEDVVLLRDYNQQLRKALGQNNGNQAARDTLRRARTDPEFPKQIPTALIQRRAEPDRAENESGITAEYTAPGPQRVRGNVSVELPLLWPATGYVSQSFDASRHHYGIDIAAKMGTQVYAPTDGFVVFAGWTYDDGNLLVISHGSGYLTVYKHNQVLMKSPAMAVKRGELIALLGSSGQSSLGPHLHFEVWKDGIAQDPREFLLTPATAQK
jgi:murein DD-endopeptidase MepM/ murein hydrolase activator NlpD